MLYCVWRGGPGWPRKTTLAYSNWTIQGRIYSWILLLRYSCFNISHGMAKLSPSASSQNIFWNTFHTKTSSYTKLVLGMGLWLWIFLTTFKKSIQRYTTELIIILLRLVEISQSCRSRNFVKHILAWMLCIKASFIGIFESQLHASL